MVREENDLQVLSISKAAILPILVRCFKAEHIGFIVLYRKVYMIPEYVNDGDKLFVGKHETVDITTIVIFLIAGLLISLPSIAAVMGSLTYIIGIVVLISSLITLMWSLARSR